MNAKHFAAALLLAALQLPAADQAPAQTNAAGTVFPKSTVVLSNRMDKISYAIGIDMASMFREFDGVKKDLVLAGVKDVLERHLPAITPQEMTTLLKDYENEMRQKEMKEAQESAAKNKEDGAKFLAENKSKEGIKVLPSGLQYKVLKDGTGPSAKLEDTVTVHYRGTLLDGKEFDSSFKRKAPSTVAMRYLIPGWKEALQLMKTGSKWQLFVPAELAYGERGAGRDVPANATLIYELELIEVAPK